MSASRLGFEPRNGAEQPVVLAAPNLARFQGLCHIYQLWENIGMVIGRVDNIIFSHLTDFICILAHFHKSLSTSDDTGCS